MRAHDVPGMVLGVVLLLLGTLANAQPGPMVGGWVSRGMDPMTGVPMQIEYTFLPNGAFQKSLTMPGGYDFISGRWFTQGNVLRLDVVEHYSTAGQGPLPPGESWFFEMPNGNMLVLVNAACPSPQMIDACRLVLQRGQ